MSTTVMAACWPLQMPPTPKAVLISLADNANDAGYCWPSISTICERTCFGRTAVMAAIQWLEDNHAVQADRSNGRHTTYVVTPSAYQSASRTGPADEPVRQTNTTSPAGGRDQSASRTAPVRQADSNHQEPSRTVSKSNRQKAPACAVACPDGVSEQTWADWLALRKAKKAPVSETVLREAIRESAKAGLTLNRFLEIWCARGSQGLQADWLKPNERAGPAPPSQQPSKTLSAVQTLQGMKHGNLAPRRDSGRIEQAPLLELGSDPGK